MERERNNPPKMRSENSSPLGKNQSKAGNKKIKINKNPCRMNSLSPDVKAKENE